MYNTTLKNIFDFLEKKGEHKAPIKWKVLNNIPLTVDDFNGKGTFDLSHTNITSLPGGLKVWGNLRLNHTKIKSLPEGLEVGGWFDLRNSEIISLPKGLKVGDSLDLNNSTSLTSLPEGMKVGGFLHLDNCKSLTSLPEGLKVGGDLDIVYTKLEKYTDEQLREMVKPGFIQGKINR